MLTGIQKDDRVRQVEQAKATMNRIGTQLIAEKKAAIAREASEKKGHGGGGQSLQGRDLLTLLIKANMATDIPDSQRLSDADVLSRKSCRSCNDSCVDTNLSVSQRSRREPLLRSRKTHVDLYPLDSWSQATKRPAPPRHGVYTRSPKPRTRRRSSARSC